MQYLETRRQCNLLYFFTPPATKVRKFYVWFQLHVPRILNIFGRDLYVTENTSDYQNKSEKYTDVKTSRLQWFGQAVYVFYNTGALLLKDR